jgi:hypothetical protein
MQLCMTLCDWMIVAGYEIDNNFSVSAASVKDTKYAKSVVMFLFCMKCMKFAHIREGCSFLYFFHL